MPIDYPKKNELPTRSLLINTRFNACYADTTGYERSVTDRLPYLSHLQFLSQVGIQ
jgi:hypothetical protein